MPKLFLLLSTLLLLGALPAQDPAKDLKSKDALERLAAVDQLAQGGADGAEKLLTGALKDKDWEVQERAARALGEVGSADAVDALVKLALNGPVARVRLAAARSAAKLSPDEALEDVAKKASGDTAFVACDAIAVIAPRASEREAPKNVKKLVGDKDARLRAAGARAYVVCSDADRLEVLAELFEDEHLGVRAAAAEGAALDPRASQLELLRAELSRRGLDRTVERRLVAAVAASAGAAESPESAATAEVAALSASSDAAVAMRGALLVAACAREDWCGKPALLTALEPLLSHADVGVRAVAAGCLSSIGGDDARARAQALAKGDSAARVRRQAVRELTALGVAKDEGTLAFLVERLGAEPDAQARELIVCALAVEEQDSVVQPLIAALNDADWGVAVCAAVSLGATRSADGIPALEGLSGHNDWRMRGAAVVGLSKSLNKDAIPALITRLEDTEPAVVRTAHSFLESVAKQNFEVTDLEAWRAWFREKGDRLRLYDPKELEERRKKYGYVVDPAQVFQGIDVLVFDSRGDHIQNLLEHLSIEHRLTQSGQVAGGGLDAAGVFVSNCTGEMLPADVERLQWFVRVGGYLFGSCWALHETVARVAPGAVGKLNTNGEVLDDVLARACVPDSAFLEGVFEEGVVPVYHLEGAHLIDVHEPEHVEVLVDSPECAERWGGGELACWFRMGHGVMLDSTNHFDLQGLELATDLKKPEDRMAYAMDHMGIDYATIRETQKEKWWKSNNKAAREVKDLSTLELVTNFVRLRRVEGR
ncbi:MAG: HEAT repeat domain-containing protein [Planctomycetes bacterium]|nr:HEAT repeat domain-containing protein [Planctomycetota bacterium]